MDITDFINEAPKYDIGDILELVGYNRYFLIEEIDEYRYCYRELTSDTTERDTFFYIDSNTKLVKVA